MKSRSNAELQTNITRQPEVGRRSSRPAIALALAAFGGIQLTGSGPDIVQIVYDAQRDCQDPSATDISTTTGLMQVVPEVQQIVTPLREAENMTELDYRDLALEVLSKSAAEYGLTVPDMTADTAPLRKDIALEYYNSQSVTDPEGNDALPISTYFDLANETIEKNYGLSVHYKSKNTMLAPEKAINLATMTPTETLLLKANILLALDTLNEMPVEYVDMTGVKKIVFADIPVASDGFQAHGFANLYNDTIVLKYDEPLAPAVINHEFFHHLDYSLCGGGFTDDTRFASINPLPPEEFYSGDRMTQVSASEDFISHAEIVIVGGIDDKPLKKVVNKPYSYTGLIEDKATVGEIIHDYPSFREFFITTSSSDAVLNDKLVFLFSRIYAANPDVAKYLIAKADVEFLTEIIG